MRGSGKPAVALCLPLVIALIASGAAGAAGPPGGEERVDGGSVASGTAAKPQRWDFPTVSDGGDYVVDPPGWTLCGPFKVQGSIVVKPDATLTMGGCPGFDADFEIIQAPGDDFNIVLEDRAKLVVSGARVSSDLALDVEGNGSATLVVDDSKVDLRGGEIRGTFNTIDVLDAELSGSGWTAVARATVERSSISMKNLVLSMDSEMDTVSMTGEILVIGGVSLLTDVRAKGFNASGPAAEARLHRWVDVSVVDGLSVPVEGASVDATNLVEKNTTAKVATGPDGRARIQLVHDILSESRPDPPYVGNWRIDVKMPGGASKQVGVSLPHYQHPNQPLSISHAVGFREVQVPEPTAQDLSFDKSWAWAGLGEEKPSRWKGNIDVKPGATLTLGPDLYLEFPADAVGRSIIVRSGATLRLAGATITGCLGLYVEAGGKVEGSGLTSDCGLGSLAGTFEADSASFRGGMSGDFDSVRSQGLRVLGQTNVSASKEIDLVSSAFGDDAALTAPTLVLNGVGVNGALSLPGRTGELTATSLSYKSLDIDPKLTLKLMWKLAVEVRNGGDRLVPDALVTVEPQSPLGSNTTSARTGTNGRISPPFELLGEIISDGNVVRPNLYLVQAKFDKGGEFHAGDRSPTMDRDTDVTLKFNTTIIPPEDLRPVLDGIRSEYEPGARIDVAGTVTRNADSELVANATVTLTIQELGQQLPPKQSSDNGRFYFQMTAPQTEGRYTIRVDVYDPVTKLRGHSETAFTVKKSEIVPLTITILAVIVIGSIAALYSVSRYRKWQDFRREARENPLFKEERMFDEVERQLRTELAREMRRTPLGVQRAGAEPAAEENGRAKRKRGGPLGTDGGSHLAALASRIRRDDAAAARRGEGKPSSHAERIDAPVVRRQ